MENSSCFFSNKDCKYYPCHKGLEQFNCLFCYCPLYWLECPGNHEFFEKGGVRLKNCVDCRFPHHPENYNKIMEILKSPEPLLHIFKKKEEKFERSFKELIMKLSGYDNMV